MLSACSKPTAPLNSLAHGAMAKLEVPAQPRPAPAATFLGPDGKTLSLADFKGKVVVVNLWATWCAPCVAEMPTLAQLQTAYAGKPVQVLAISIDRPEDKDAAARFLAKHGGLTLYRDPAYALPFALNPRAEGVPTTVIYDKAGLERARLSGGADWASPEAKAVIDDLLQRHG